MNYAFIFICQSGELEAKSSLLAASLSRQLRVEAELIAAIPQPAAHWGEVAPPTIAFLKKLGVRLEPISNPIGLDYPIGNKLACLNVETQAEKLVFVDSDMLCMGEFHHHERFEREFNAKPADLASWGSLLSLWERPYSLAGLPTPRANMFTTVSEQLMAPYFNAGFVATTRGSDLGAEWIRLAKLVDADSAIVNKRPWLDQITLPIAVTRLQLETDYLDERYNFPCHLKPMSSGLPPMMCHYHTPDYLVKEPSAISLVTKLLDDHPELIDLLKQFPNWGKLLEIATLRNSRPASCFDQLDAKPLRQEQSCGTGADLVITGLPRSGTSYLCSLINRQSNCVVLNEPATIFSALTGEGLPWGIASIYREYRARILAGETIENKLLNGEFIEDTALVDKVEPWTPLVTRSDFLFATKNTLAYLARIPEILKAMPQAKICACVRHPMETIASWKGTFAHLANAELELQSIGNSTDKHLSGDQRSRLQEIAETKDLPVKRALMWRHLALLLIESKSRIAIFRYEDIVSDPGAALEAIFASGHSTWLPKVTTPINISQPRSKRQSLTRADIDAIRGICTQVATQLGYSLI